MDAKAAERKAGLDNYVASATGILMLARQYPDAQAVAIHGPKITAEVATLAGRYENLGVKIDKLIAASPFAGLVMAVMPLALQVAVNHGLIKSPAMFAQLGIQSPEVLEAEGKAAEMKMMRDAIEAQKRYAAEQAAFNAELADFSANGAGSGLPE